MVEQKTINKSVGIANETMYVLTGKFHTAKPWEWNAIGQFPNEGKPAQVDFNPNDVIQREMSHRDIIGFYHTHPCEAYTSDTDIITMDAWVDVLGKPLLCLIEGTNGLLTWYWLGEARSQQGKSYRWENKFWGYIQGDK